MRLFGLAALPALMLAGCGEQGEDFTVEVKRPAATVYAPLSTVDISDARLVFPGIAVNRTRPSDGEILYTIPGKAGSDATIRLRLEPVRDGEATIIHATVETPPMRAQIDGVDKQLSETRVEAALKRILRSMARNLEMGSAAAQADSMQLSGLLVGLAIGTNPQYLDEAMALKSHPEKLAEALAPFNDRPQLPDDFAGDLPRAMDAPEIAAGEEGFASTADDWGEGTPGK